MSLLTSPSLLEVHVLDAAAKRLTDESRAGLYRLLRCEFAAHLDSAKRSPSNEARQSSRATLLTR
jgi:hypothetical protein